MARSNSGAVSCIFRGGNFPSANMRGTASSHKFNKRKPLKTPTMVPSVQLSPSRRSSFALGSEKYKQGECVHWI